MTLAHWNKLIIKKSQIKMAFLFSFLLFCGVHQTNSNEKSKHRPKNILQTQNNVKSRLKSNNEKRNLRKLRIKITTTLNLPH